MLHGINNKWPTEELNIIKVNGDYDIEMTEFDINIFSMLERKNYKNILDLGCGQGKNSLILAKKGYTVYSTDVSLEALEKLKTRIIQENIENIKVYNYSFTNLGFNDNYFDIVLCKSTLHHATLDEIKLGISEAFRVLKPRGCFVFDMISKEDESYGKGELIEKDTFVGSREGEEGIPHHYTNINELQNTLDSFNNVNITKKLYIISLGNEKKYKSKMYDIIAFK